MTRLAIPLLVALASAAAAAQQVPLGQLVEGLQCVSDPTQTYTLYLPPGYTPERQWPAMLVLDPRGRSRLAAELFREGAEVYGWILVSSDNTRSDGPWEPNVVAMRALWPEVNTRFATDPKRIYAAGFSGGAHLAWVVGKNPGVFAGVIASGGRVVPEGLGTEPTFASFAAAGTLDFNYQGTREMDQHFAKLGAPHRVEIFEGQHQWMPPALARQGVDWMELRAMAAGLRPRDDELVERLHAADLTAARDLETSGDLLAAMRRYDAIARTFAPLRDVAGERAKASELEATSSVKKALKEEKRWDEYEANTVARLFSIDPRLSGGDEPMPAPRILRELEVKSLQRMAGESSYGGVTARRLLETIFVRMAFYLTRDYMGQGEYRKATTVLEVASAIHENSTGVAYNLACSYARLGETQRALEALEHAVELGYSDVAHMQDDADLESLRKDQRFQALVAGVKAKQQ